MNNALELNFGVAISGVKKVIYLGIKRFVDLYVGLFGVILLIPITLILKIAYMITGDFHRILFTQKRIGKNGQEFKFVKFRSMIPNADEVLFKLMEENEDIRKEYEENKKLKDDPRITKIGKFIRRTSIDELPQMLNVFMGDMSLVGNRPYLPREKKDMGAYFNDIVKTKPGLTGYWQVNLRSRGTFKQRLKMEKYYSDHAGLRLDLKIFFKTIKVVLKRDGAE